MQVLIHSPAFSPKVGGLEGVTESVARELSGRGHEVTVLCQVNASTDDAFPFEVLRCPTLAGTLACWRRADVALHMNVSLKGLLPQLISGIPWVAAHHGWYSASDLPPTPLARVKMAAARHLASRNIAVSEAVARYLGFSCAVIHNPYDHARFRRHQHVERDLDFLFVGRLVSDKNPALLLEAAALLQRQGLRPGLSITGSGPEESRLRARARALGLTEQVCFTGRMEGDELARWMNRHRALVVPSSVREGFGVVALEGLACGCHVLAADRGGLPEAVGACGTIFPSDDAAALAAGMARVLRAPEKALPPPEVLASHLGRHRPDFVAGLYESELLLAAGKARADAG